MHVIVADAASTRTALSDWPSPVRAGLTRWLAQAQASAVETLDPAAYSTPAHRLLARALGLPQADGAIAWAAARALALGLATPAGHGWAYISLCRWRLDTQQLCLQTCPLTDMDADETAALCAAMAPYWQEDGLQLQVDAPGRLRACGAALATLRCADPEQALGRDLRQWMPQGPAASTLLRLQSEMQMLLDRHPVQSARRAAGRTPVNALWLHGAGRLDTPPAQAPAAVQIITHLSAPALAQDTRAWASAWTAVWAEIERLQPRQISLCGPAAVQTWTRQRSGWLARALRGWARTDGARVLHALAAE